MPNPQEDALREMLQQEMQRNGSTAVRTVPTLPDLDPAMFLSPSAQKEFYAASSPAASVEVQPYHADWVISESEMDAATASADPDQTLASIFMERAVRETGASIEEAISRISSSDDFSFEPVEASTTPNERVRFQVGRESPPQVPFYSSPPRSSDGVEVARVRNGRFEHNIPINPRMVSVTETPRVASVTRSEPVEAPVRSRYDVLRGPSIL